MSIKRSRYRGFPSPRNQSIINNTHTFPLSPTSFIVPEEQLLSNLLILNPILFFNPSHSRMKSFYLPLALLPLTLAVPQKQTSQSRTACGSRGLPECPTGQTCIPNPARPGCDPRADCPGICVTLESPLALATRQVAAKPKSIEGQPCGGFLGRPCDDPSQTCIDDPNDGCDPDHGGADCIGICVAGSPPAA